ncbi:sigma 54-interacting transcriptional regulator [Myxococcota bacterium]|nr:sigma 54-interacting transcriptional regulator [Myxococcota bacterium]
MLLDVSQALAGADELPTALHKLLERLERHKGLEQGMIAVLDQDAGDIHIIAAIGVGKEGRAARYELGEGITGRVIESAKPVVVPAVSKEPLFLNRALKRPSAGAGAEASFVAAPISMGKKVIGALSVLLPFVRDRDYEEEVRFLGVVASMIGLAMTAREQVAAERERLLEENTSLRQELQARYELPNIVGTAGPMRQVYEQITQVARTNTTVLVRGESGTGKELIAHAIHYGSLRAKKPFVKVSCAALPGTLIEAELFGYEKGAFTGAHARKKGRFELADGGTLFLDEIGDVDLGTQVKLLRVLQEREFERLGGTETIKANVRLIAATNKDLETAVREKTFREDLYYRLNVFSIFAPPLRDRTSDVLLLADHFLTKYARAHKKSIKRISTPAIDMLSAYHWPGNVRELENTIERAVLVCDGQVIHGHHLPPTLQTAEASGTLAETSLADAVEQFEKDMILDALKSSRGNRAKAARLLQTTERILGYKVGKYAIDCDRFRA